MTALRDSRARAAVVAVAGVLVAAAVTQLLLPGGRSGNGTPSAILFRGAVAGLVNGLLAAGIVIVYRSAHVVNFAQIALGAAGGVFTYNLTALAGWPYLLAFAGGLVVSTGLAVAMELAFVRRFFDAPRLVLTVITGGMSFVLLAAARFVTVLPIFGDIQDRTVEEITGGAPVRVPFEDWSFRVGRFPLDFGFAHVFTVAVALAALITLAAFLRFSRLGIAVRAAAENADRARLLGIGIGMLSSVVWGIAGLLGGLGVILDGTVRKQFSFFEDPFSGLLLPMAAAVVARMSSIPAAVGAAVGLAVLDDAVQFSYPGPNGIREVGLFCVILAGLVLGRERFDRSERAETSSWQGIQEQRPIPVQLLGVAGIGIWRRVVVGAGIVIVLSVPWVATPRQTFLTAYYVILAMVLISLNVLTGWAGQVSWGQLAFVAVGAVLGGAATSRWGIPFWIAILLVPLATAGFTMLVGLPALRVRGLFLGVATLAFAYAVKAALFNPAAFGWLLPDRIDRPRLFLLDFQDERSMYYLVVAGFLLVVLAVTTLRRGRTGRVLIALRDNEPNVQAFGVNAVRMRLAAFGISGFICGFAGVLLAHHQRAATASLFPAQLSVQLFALAVVGGVGSVFGVVLGAAYFAATELVPNQIVAFVLGPFGILFLLYAVPGGLAGLVTGVRDGVLRIVAQRRHIVVPSLFADYDPEALERRLAPLAEPMPAGGLSALPPDQRYRTDSALYGLQRRDGAASRRAREDAAAIGAAVGRFASDDGDGAPEDADA